MREIKFRAWDIELKKMWFPTLIGVTGDFALYSNPNKTQKEIEGTESFRTHWNNEIGFKKTQELMQFTGLKDKNGVEIYEGDIVKLTCGAREFDNKNPLYATITWRHIGFHPQIWDKEILVKGGQHDGEMVHMQQVHLWHGSHGCFASPSFMEIIGNIYQNPDLLK